MWGHFRFIPFLIALAVGLFQFYTKGVDKSDRVVKWPHPENAGKVIYRDRNGFCQTFEAQLTDCAKVKENLVPQHLE